MRFRAEEQRQFKRLRGFDRSKGHFSPKFHSDAALRFLVRLVGPELEDEVSRVRDGVRQLLGLGSRQLKMDNSSPGEWNLVTPGFGYHIQLTQGEAPDSVRILREWSLEREWQSLPGELGQLFPAQADLVVLPTPSGVTPFHWITHFEAMLKKEGGELEEREDHVTYRSPQGGEMVVSFETGEWQIRPPQVYGFLEMAKWLKGRPEALVP